MAKDRTFTIIKPDAITDKYVGRIITKIYDAGFSIIAMKYIKLTTDQAKEFYAVHVDKPFYAKLIKFMTSGPVIVAILKKDNAVEDYRKLMGTTDPAEAEEGTIRHLFARDVTENAVHGSDSEENAESEINFFFSRIEQIEY
jgi:nucleoside-diphosphate kinase